MRETQIGSGRCVRVIGFCILAAATAGLTGCSDSLKSENNKLLAENSELRREKAQYESALGSLEDERAELAGQVSALERRLSDSRSTVPMARTGFEGIPGVSGVQVGGSGEVVVNLEGDVLFTSGSTTLRRDAKTTLDRIARVIRDDYRGDRIRIEGYTDSDPIKKSKWKTNERLSGERAMAVEQYLVSKGLDNESIYFAGFGSANPKGSKKASRRVEIVIVRAGG